MELNTAISNILVMAGWTAALTTVAVMGLASSEHRSPFASVNAISHIAFGEVGVYSDLGDHRIRSRVLQLAKFRLMR